MARPSQRTDDELSAIYSAWMTSKKITRRNIALHLIRLNRFPRPANDRQIRDLIKLSPFSNKGIMKDVEFDEVKRTLFRGLKCNRNLKSVLRDCQNVRERHGWSPTSRNSARSKLKAALESSGFKSGALTSTIVNVLEHMETTTLLNDRLPKDATDTQKELAQLRGIWRQKAARRLFEVNEGSQVSAIKSGSLEPVISAGFGPKTPHDSALDCQTHMRAIKNLLSDHQGLPWMLAAIINDECVWQTRVGIDVGSGIVTHRTMILKNIRSALDIVAEYFGISHTG